MVVKRQKTERYMVVIAIRTDLLFRTFTVLARDSEGKQPMVVYQKRVFKNYFHSQRKALQECREHFDSIKRLLAAVAA